MSAITWKNVSAPTFSAANQLMISASKMIGDAFGTVTDTLNKAHDDKTDKYTSQAIGQMLNAGNDQERQDIMSRLDPTYADAGVIALAGQKQKESLLDMAAKEFDVNNQQAIFDAEMALTQAQTGAAGRRNTGIGGGSGSGSRGKEGTYITDEEGAIFNQLLDKHRDEKTFKTNYDALSNEARHIFPATRMFAISKYLESVRKTADPSGARDKQAGLKKSFGSGGKGGKGGRDDALSVMEANPLNPFRSDEREVASLRAIKDSYPGLTKREQADVLNETTQQGTFGPFVDHNAYRTGLAHKQAQADERKRKKLESRKTGTY